MKPSLYAREESGYNLFDPNNFTPAISAYLRAESTVLAKTLSRKSCLVEVGCGKAENLTVACELNKRYWGIDPVDEYLASGREKIAQFPSRNDHELIKGYAENLDQILADQCASSGIDISELLVFYPFNCVGNFSNLSASLIALSKSGADFLISAFLSTDQAREERARYYEQSGLSIDDVSTSERGTIFRDYRGYEIIGLSEDYFTRALLDVGLKHDKLKCDQLACFYYSNNASV